MNRRHVVGLLGLSLTAAACGFSVPAPAKIAFGHARCARCGTILYGMEGAAQAVSKDGAVRYYDDLGCMATDPEALRGRAQLYVQMAGSRGWARVEDVTFAAPPNKETAHGYGYLPYPEEEARRIAPDKWARGWSDLVAELARKPAK